MSIESKLDEQNAPEIQICRSLNRPIQGTTIPTCHGTAMKSIRSSFKRAEAQLPIPTVPLEPEHLNLVNVAMNTRSKTKRWHNLLQTDVSMVLYDALFCASTALQSTSLRDRFVAPEAIRPTGVLDRELSNEEKAELGIVLRRALKNGNWEDIILHRLSFFLLFSF